MPQVEVEVKFLLLTSQEQSLLEGATLVADKQHNVDVYFDNDEYTLTLADRWLRRRNGSFELKDPMQDRTHKGHAKHVDQYREICDEAMIARVLGVPLLSGQNLLEALAAVRIVPFATIVAERAKYRKEGFIIDIDQIKGYRLCEIEVIADSGSEEDRAKATFAIEQFAARHGLVRSAVLGKLPWWMRVHRPEHYAALVGAGIIVDPVFSATARSY